MPNIIISTCLDCGYPVTVTASDRLKGGYLWYCTNKGCQHADGYDLPSGKKPAWARGDVDVSTHTVTGGRETINTSEKETA